VSDQQKAGGDEYQGGIGSDQLRMPSISYCEPCRKLVREGGGASYRELWRIGMLHL